MISIIIVSYNRDKSLEELFESLANQKNKDFEVIIIDGGSTDRTSEIIERFKKHFNLLKCSLIDKSLVYCRNFGLKKARGEIISYIDDDVVLDKDWTEAVNFFLSDKRIGGVTGPTIIPRKYLLKRDIFIFWNKKVLRDLYCKLFLEGNYWEVGRICRSGAVTMGSNFKTCLKIQNKEVDYLEACNMSFRKSLVKKVGGFSQEFQGTSEWSEPDLAIRIKKIGYKMIFDRRVMLTHKPSREGNFSKRVKAKERMDNFLKFYLKYIYQDRWEYRWRVFSYVLFLDIYFIYKFLKEREIQWLKGLRLFIYG